MHWPHEREFRGRAVLFWGLTLLALVRARSVPGVSDRAMVLSALAAAVASLLIYAFTQAVGSVDARFRHVHPRKFRVSNLAGFYLFAGLAAGFVIASPWLVDRDRLETPPELIAFYLLAPCMASAAAGVHRILDRHRPQRPDTGS